jgi:hypothetical protein
VQTLPYHDLPKKMKIAMIHYIVFWLNLIPKSDQDYLPKDLIFGEEKIDHKTLCQLPFGAYVQLHNDKEITKNMESRTTGAMILGPTGNVQGTHNFFSLKTGEILVRQNWIELPVPNDVIIRIKELTEEPSGLNGENFFGDEEEVEAETMNESVEEDEQVAESLMTEFGNKESTNDKMVDVMIDETTNENVEGLIENKGLTYYNGDKDTMSSQEQEVMHGYNLRSSRVKDYSYKFSFL